MHVNITSAGKWWSLIDSWLFQSSDGFFNPIFFFSAGILTMLDETDDRLVLYALKQLNELVDMFWPEIADSITAM